MEFGVVRVKNIRRAEEMDKRPTQNSSSQVKLSSGNPSMSIFWHALQYPLDKFSDRGLQ